SSLRPSTFTYALLMDGIPRFAAEYPFAVEHLVVDGSNNVVGHAIGYNTIATVQRCQGAVVPDANAYRHAVVLAELGEVLIAVERLDTDPAGGDVRPVFDVGAL